MNIQIEQGCPQCGATITLTENDRLITCPYCGTKNYLHNSGVFRYVVPPRYTPTDESGYFMVPYIRFKGTIFLVSSQGITHKVVDTTQVATDLSGVQPSLGVRPQAMKLQRLSRQYTSRFFRRSLQPQVILEKAVQISALTASASSLYHRAYIGENLSVIYLPLVQNEDALHDSVTNTCMVTEPELWQEPKATISFHPSWQVESLASLCPHCGAGLEGAADSQVLHCLNCTRAWAFTEKSQLEQVSAAVVEEIPYTSLYLPFWLVQGTLPALGIQSFADFLERTNQPQMIRDEWRSTPMRFVVPGFKMRPKIFLQVGKQGSLNGYRINQTGGTYSPKLSHPVTLPASEALQSVKVILATCATASKFIYPYLPKTSLHDPKVKLVYLPFQDRGHDWVQPDMGMVIGKNILKFGRSM